MTREIVHHILIAAEADHATEIAEALAPTVTTRIVAGTKATIIAAVETDHDVTACGVSTAVDRGAGVEILRNIAATCPGLPTFLIAIPGESSEINKAGSLGIPVLVWPFDAANVTGLIDAHAQRMRASVERVIRTSFMEIVNPSTPWSREDEVCWQTVLGAMPKEIADDRGIKDKIVYGMQDRLRQRLKIQSVSDLRDLILGRVLPNWRSKR